MKITFLGTGTSQGVPVIACHCEVCSSTDKRDNRLRASIMVQHGSHTIVIDTGPDFRQQMLKQRVDTLDAIVFTHEHKDHIAGLDDVRAFNYFQKKRMDVYAHTRVQQALMREYPYVFNGNNYPGIPEIDLHDIRTDVPFTVGDIHLLPLEVMHHQLPVHGFRIGSFAYITDANFISPHVMSQLHGVQHFVINALRHEKHISHFTLNEALAIIAQLNPHKAYLTHISHQLGTHAQILQMLPPNVVPAHDGMVIDLQP